MASVRKKNRPQATKFPKWLFALFAATVFATAQAETAPDALVKTVATDVTNVPEKRIPGAG